MVRAADDRHHRPGRVVDRLRGTGDRQRRPGAVCRYLQQAVLDVTAGRLRLDGPRRNGDDCLVAGGGTSYVVAVNGLSGTGTLGLNLVDGDSIVDAGGNPLGGPGMGNSPFVGQTFNVVNWPKTLAMSIVRSRRPPARPSAARWPALPTRTRGRRVSIRQRSPGVTGPLRP